MDDDKRYFTVVRNLGQQLMLRRLNTRRHKSHLSVSSVSSYSIQTSYAFQILFLYLGLPHMLSIQSAHLHNTRCCQSCASQITFVPEAKNCLTILRNGEQFVTVKNKSHLLNDVFGRQELFWVKTLRKMIINRGKRNIIYLTINF